MHNKTKIAQFTLQTLLICLLTATAMVQAKTSETLKNQPIQNGESIQPGQTPDGLSTPEWSSIQQQINAGKYRAYPDATGGYHSSNPAHGWQIRYSNNGTTTLRPRNNQTSGYHLGMRLKAIGYQTLQQLGQPQQIKADNSMVTYQWNDTIKEWWINSPTRLEQWFSIAKRPKDISNGVPLTLQMTLDSELQARQSENSIQFTDATGTRITYDKLKVWDAKGQPLPAKMQLSDNILSLIVEDGDAQYPLTIDPSFQQQTYLKASNADGGDYFGGSMAIDGNTLVIGAIGEASSASTVNGDQSDNSAIFSGAAYVFIRRAGVWTQQAYLKASNASRGDVFGSAVAISGDTLVVGAPNTKSGKGGGTVYVFTRIAGVWTEQALLQASNGSGGEFFGGSVAIDGDTIVVGAEAAARVYIFTRNVGIWTQQSSLSTINGDVAIAGDTLVVGSSENAYVFTRNGDVWTQQADLNDIVVDSFNNNIRKHGFGLSVAIASNTVVVGAPLVDGNNLEPYAGAAYVFTRNAGIWTQQAYLKASNAETSVRVREFLDNGDSFGTSVAISGDTVVIGSPGEDSNATTVNGDQSDNSALSAGAAYVFTRNSELWSQQTYLKASNAGTRNNFGYSVVISGNTIVAGALGEESKTTTINGNQNDNSRHNIGAAYVFNLASSTTAECTLNADGNTSTDALTDGMLFIRYLFGARGDSLTADAVATDCVNCTAAEIEPILEQCATTNTSDIDGNGEVDALTDGLLIFRYLSGIRGDALTEGSVANDCSRCNAPEIEVYLQELAPLVNRLPDPATGNQISGVVWLDSNDNDVQDGNEAGAELITVTVTDESIPI
ncbi:MAG: FG-GAP repeat protein, partial [Methylococcales bacterium]